MTLPLFLLPGLTAADSLHLDGPEGDHARRAMRLGVGDELEVSNGSGLRLHCQVTGLPAQGLQLDVLHRRQESPAAPQITLVQALAKGNRDEMAVEICVEVGADQVIPWQADRSISRWVGPKAERGRQKWQNLVQAATKQSRRAYLPSVCPCVNSAELAQLIADATARGDLAVICHEEAADTLPAAVSDFAGQHLLVIVGPEGGISPEERDLFVASGARLALLGPNVLRSSTAGAVAITALNYLTGRWESGRVDSTTAADTKAGSGHPDDSE